MSNVGEYGCRLARGVAPVSTKISLILKAMSSSSLAMFVPSRTTCCEAFASEAGSASRRRSWCAGNSLRLSRVYCIVSISCCASVDGIGASRAMRSGKTGLHTLAMLAAYKSKGDSTHLALSPVCHLLQRQLRPVDGRRLQPYR
jgi:hypothetical protein